MKKSDLKALIREVIESVVDEDNVDNRSIGVAEENHAHGPFSNFYTGNQTQSSGREVEIGKEIINLLDTIDSHLTTREQNAISKINDLVEELIKMHGQ